MKFTSGLLSLSFLALGLLGCSAKISGAGDGIAAPEQKAFQDTVTGPSLDGEYKSQCVVDRWARDSGYVTFDVTIRGRNITREESTFTDAQCLHAGPAKTLQGEFRYVTKKNSNTYEVEYRFHVANRTTKSGENIRVTNGVLYISDRITGDAYPDIALTLQPAK